ncbi:glutathione S-transferase family protein [Novosphingobium sp. JCM 18896]|uniref:glutathione S-transferase family protein n=1 Tax=Novosphingobium sp. JCM 18896 TaxID=2989731 RepID=UPI002221974B|nr:glutathione S-transferase family protein [Novosphingobium sp. JCM 18896]MCW1428883.1 glutathione S-transferase family protein [Novosphingobium sp. JCM 18896]
MLTIHHLRQSVSDRVIWLCEELGLPYRLETYDREPSMAAPPPYKALTRFGTAPVITDGALTLGESGAIVEYVCRKHAGGRLMPGADHADFADYLFWFHFANGSMVPAFMIEHVTTAAGIPAGPSPTRGERVVAMIEARLGEAPYFAGSEFTAADVMMALPRLAERFDLDALPNIRGYLDRVTARPAWQRTDALR